jgi:glyoxylase-like metal-dependent hydrolase (beta-lactamase superfamily II)
VNIYLIDDDPLTLIDAGPYWDLSLGVLEDALRALGRPLHRIERVVITHQHLDHFGLAQTLVDRSGADLVALDAVAEWFASYPTSIELEDDFAARVLRRHGASELTLEDMALYNLEARAFGAPATVTHPVEDGDVLEFAERTLHVLHRPGHSPSDTLFHDPERGLLLGGDHLMHHVRSIPIITAPLDGSEVHVRPRAYVQYLESLRATRTMDLELVLPGHGDPVTDHRALIDERLRRNDIATDRVAALLTPELSTASELALALRGGNGGPLSFFALCDVLGHLDRLLDSGVAVEHDGPVKQFALRTDDV